MIPETQIFVTYIWMYFDCLYSLQVWQHSIPLNLLPSSEKETDTTQIWDNSVISICYIICCNGHGGLYFLGTKYIAELPLTHYYVNSFMRTINLYTDIICQSWFFNIGEGVCHQNGGMHGSLWLHHYKGMSLTKVMIINSNYISAIS